MTKLSLEMNYKDSIDYLNENGMIRANVRNFQVASELESILEAAFVITDEDEGLIDFQIGDYLSNKEVERVFDYAVKQFEEDMDNIPLTECIEDSIRDVILEICEDEGIDINDGKPMKDIKNDFSKVTERFVSIRMSNEWKK